jgi:cofilin
MKKRYIIYRIEGDKEIVQENCGDREETYEQFATALQASGEPRYGVVDVEFETTDGRPNSKIVFVAYVPDTAKVKQKMVYSGSKDALKRVLLGIMVDINATDASELELETCVLPKCR